MPSTIEIIPAIMPDTLRELESQATLVHNLVDWVQIDVMDGVYTDSVSWPYAKGSRHVGAIFGEADGLPHWEDLNYEIDLMVNNPYIEAPRWIDAGAARLIIHHKTLFKGGGEDLIASIKERGVEVVLALTPDEMINVVQQYIHMIDGIQCMGIERVGFQGEPFAEQVLDNIEALRNMYPDMPISVDGGINPDRVPDLIEAGATRLISGSYIFTSGDVAASIAELKKMSNV